MKKRRNKVRYGAFSIFLGTGLLYLSRFQALADSTSVISSNSLLYFVMAIAGGFCIVLGTIIVLFVVASGK